MKALCLLPGRSLAIIAAFYASLFCIDRAHAAMVDSSMFTGIQADLSTAAVGIMACAAIILGIGLLVRALTR